MLRLKNLLRTARRISTVSDKKAPSQLRATVNIVFGKYLLLTNTVSSGVLMFIGDICQQEIEYQQKILAKRYDYGRLTRMFLVGLGFGPLHHYFYWYLQKVLPKRTMMSITKKIMADQFVMSPVCIAFFFYGMGTLEFKPIQKSHQELKEKFIYVYAMDWCVWPPTQFLNFYYIPVKYQVLYINAVTMVYNVFLSYVKHMRPKVEVIPKTVAPRKDSDI